MFTRRSSFLRKRTTMSLLTILFHFSAFSVYSYCIYYSEFHLEVPQTKAGRQRGGRYKYLTHWNLCLQGFMFFLCCVIDKMPRKYPLRRKLVQFKSHLFVSLSLPLCLFVSSVFWGLYAVDRELIFPKVLDQYYPSWLNHMSHTSIVPLVLIDTWLCYHPLPTRKSGMATLFSFVATYLLWVLYLGAITDVWVYPILSVLNWIQKILFFSTCALILGFYYLVSERVNVLVSGSGPPKPAKVKEDDRIPR